MINYLSIQRSVLFTCLILITLGCSKSKQDIEIPNLLYADGKVLVSLRNDFETGNPEVNALIGKLIDCADQSMDLAPFSVMQKDVVPPSGDKHDYISQGPYWWPDTTKADGLPYIRRDGVVNPERSKFSDRQNLHDLIQISETLSKAYFFTKDEKYAARASELLKVWFIDDATRMNPNLEYGQGIPGRTEGRGIGIIETRHIGKIADVATLIQDSEAWGKKEEDALKSWCTAYLDWLLHSKKGIKEGTEKNNHGTWYDVQAISLALFTGQDSIAHRIAEQAKGLRMESHIMQDGSQPRELARTKSYNYSVMNLQGLFQLAFLADKVNVDLWHYKNSQGASLEDALRFLIPAALGKKDWEYEQISPIHPDGLKFHLFLATKKYNENYLMIANQIASPNNEMGCEEVGVYFY